LSSLGLAGLVQNCDYVVEPPDEQLSRYIGDVPITALAWLVVQATSVEESTPPASAREVPAYLYLICMRRLA
jgi:hypothetical protein